MSSSTEAFRVFVRALEDAIEREPSIILRNALFPVADAARHAWRASSDEDDAQEYREYETRMGDDL